MAWREGKEWSVAQPLQKSQDCNASNIDEMNAAIEYYRTHLRDRLEAEYMDQYVRFDPETGSYAVGETRGTARSNFASRFGELRGWTLNIGSI
jgi:hypothetical protein